LGAILYLQGRTAEAVQILDRARAAGEQSERALYYSGLSKSANGDYDGALADWETLAKRHADDARLELNVTRLWYLAGCSHYRQHECAQAAAAWEHYYQMYQTDVTTREALHRMYLLAVRQSLGSLTAVNALNRARELGADSAECDYLEALGQIKNGDYGRGAAALQRLVDGGRDDSKTRYNLGLAVLFEGKDQEALDHLDRAYALSLGELHARSAWALAASYARRGDWVRAADLVAEAI
jgi:tetratricopeptide (TPR) repeat protein